MFFGFLFFLRLLVAKFSEIHQPANGRRRRRGDFDEINAVLPREVQRLGQRDDAQLTVVNSDDAHFAGADFAVDPDERGGRIIAWRKRAAQDTLVGCGITIIFSIKQIGATANQNYAD